MINEVQIREINKDDYKSLTELTNLLGSDVLCDIVRQQIEEVLKTPDHYAFVALRKDKIIGYIHCFKAIRLTTRPFLEICGLIVDSKERRNGIGKLLVQKVENLNLNMDKIRVRCNTRREIAHKFYNNLNYTLKKEQKVFEKKSL